jgi:uncharacterized protein
MTILSILSAYSKGRNMKSRILSQLSFFAILLAIFSLLALPVSAQDGTPVRTITVTGVGKLQSTPAVALIELGFHIVNTDLPTAIVQTSQVMGSLQESLASYGIASADILPTGLEVTYQDQSDPNAPRVYEVGNSLQVLIRDLALVEDVLISASAAGANSIDNLSYGVLSSAFDNLHDTARARAIENANTMAAELANAYGVTLGNPISIKVTVDEEPSQSYARGALLSSAVDLDRQPRVEVTVTAEVTFAIS